MASSSTPYDADFAAATARYHLPAGLLREQARAESGFDPTVVSPAGAIGIMQFMPSTAAGLGINPRDPAQAIDGAGRLMARLLAKYGRVDLALAAYNAGEGNVDKYGGVPPFAETQDYVRKITTALRSLGGAAGSAADTVQGIGTGVLGDAAGAVIRKGADVAVGVIWGAARPVLITGVLLLSAGALVVLGGLRSVGAGKPKP